MSADVAARLAEGSAAAGAIETYVEACHAVGRVAGGLSSADVRELYAAEAGMRLDALDADSVALARLARVAEEGLRLEAEALDAVRRAWQGASGTAAAEFVERHLASGAAMAASLREASSALRSLREKLSDLVDEKVGAAVRFDDRWAAEHPVWLAEAEAVLQGLADAVAVDVVARQISPYVHSDVQSDWIPAMRGATDSVATAYDGAVAPAERPSDFAVRKSRNGFPHRCSASAAIVAGPAGAVGFGGTPQWGSAGTPQWGSAGTPQWGSAGTPQWGSAGTPRPQWGSVAAGAPSTMSSGLPDIGGVGGGLPGLVARIADVLGDYPGSPELPAADGLKPHLKADRKPQKEAKDDGKGEAGTGDDAKEAAPERNSEAPPDQVGKPVIDTPVPSVPPEIKSVGGAPVTPPSQVPPSQSSPPVQPVNPPVLVTAPPAPPAPLPPPLAAEAGASAGKPRPTDAAVRTPCSIAADELPQVGQ